MKQTKAPARVGTKAAPQKRTTETPAASSKAISKAVKEKIVERAKDTPVAAMIAEAKTKVAAKKAKASKEPELGTPAGITINSSTKVIKPEAVPTPAPAPVAPIANGKELVRLKKRLKEIDSPNVHTMPTPAAPVPVSALPTVPVTTVAPKKQPADRREAAQRAWVTIRAKRAAAAAAAAAAPKAS